jgi:hypothetical protein
MLRSEGQYAEALARYDIIRAEYRGTPPGQQTPAWAAVVPVAVGTIYNEWGQDLTMGGEYTAAVGKFDLARRSTDDAAVTAAAAASGNSSLGRFPGKSRCG